MDKTWVAGKVGTCPVPVLAIPALTTLYTRSILGGDPLESVLKAVKQLV